MKSLAAALVAAQAEMPKVEKRGKNPHFKSEYVTLDDLLDAVCPVLNRHGLAVVQFPADVDGRPALTTTIVHGDSGEQLSSTMLLLVGKQDMQAVGAAITYARRYMLAAALGIAEGTDDDGNAASAPSPRAAGATQRVAPGTHDANSAESVGELPGASASPASDAQKRKLNVLVGKLREAGKIEARQLWLAANRVPEQGEDGEVHWSTLRERLSKGEASDLIERLEKFAASEGVE